jgi:hypothetical protein
MTDYVVYHKAELMGLPAVDVGNLAIYTKKSADGAIGSRVWLIAGEESPRKYFLRATFLVNGIEPSDRAAFKHLVTGIDGQLLDPMPSLNKEPWFPAFVEEQGRFAFGFNQIKNSAAEAGLRAVLHANTLR